MTTRLRGPDPIDPEHVPQLWDGNVVLPVEDEAVLHEADSGRLNPGDPSVTIAWGMLNGHTLLRPLATTHSDDGRSWRTLGGSRLAKRS
jgi:hypothetical protein